MNSMKSLSIFKRKLCVHEVKEKHENKTTFMYTGVEIKLVFSQEFYGGCLTEELGRRAIDLNFLTRENKKIMPGIKERCSVKFNVKKLFLHHSKAGWWLIYTQFRIKPNEIQIKQ